MKILHIEAGRNFYGGTAQIQYLLKGLKSHNYEHHVLCLPQAEVGKYVSPYATVHELAFGGEADVSMYAKFRNKIRSISPDIVHIHSRKGVDLWGLLAARKEARKCIVTRRVDNTEPAWFARFKYNRADATVAISKSIEQILLNEGVKAANLQTIRSVVDTDCFKPEPDPDYWKQTWGYGSTDKVIGVVAQLIDRKGHRFLFEILPELVKRFPSVKVLVLGKGKMESTLKQQVVSLGLEQYVNFAGFHHNIEKILPNLHVLAHPALTEGLGVSLLQASACGVPVVASRVGGIPEAITHQENGLLFDAGDTQSLLASLSAILSDDNLRMTYGRNGRQNMLNGFQIDSMAISYHHLYRLLMQNTYEPVGDESDV